MHGKLENIQFWSIAGVAIGNVASTAQVSA